MRCPTCHNEFDENHSPAMPFCSDRCRQIDLGRWLDEKQAIPTWSDPDEDEEDTPLDADT